MLRCDQSSFTYRAVAAFRLACFLYLAATAAELRISQTATVPCVPVQAPDCARRIASQLFGSDGSDVSMFAFALMHAASPEVTIVKERDSGVQNRYAQTATCGDDYNSRQKARSTLKHEVCARATLKQIRMRSI